MFMYTDYNQHLLDNVKKIHFIGWGHVSSDPDPGRQGLRDLRQ